MYTAKDFRERAREALGSKWTGNRWSTYVLIALIYYVIIAAITAMDSYPLIAWASGIVSLLVAGPFTLSFAGISLNTVRGENIKLDMLFEGFKDFSRALVLYILNAVLIFLWSLLFIIPGIIKSYSYSMSYYILRDNPKISANEARKLSMTLMNGNKWRLFCLHFSFIGWFILSIFTLGILLLWIVPYFNTAEACFYSSLVQSTEEDTAWKVNGDNAVGKANDEDPFVEMNGDDAAGKANGNF